MPAADAPVTDPAPGDAPCGAPAGNPDGAPGGATRNPPGNASSCAPDAAQRSAGELHDTLTMIGSDLARLDRLIADACAALLANFHRAQAQLDAAPGGGAPDAAAIGDARQALGGAVLALQFEDIASQLIAHSQRRLRGCAQRLASGAQTGAGAHDAAPQHVNPVAQREMRAGAVELF